ncbi:MAG: tetraacyldisaccharide 4'-kinase [Burkholderiales bacterium]|nr:tetraacyldisaccharide 4'-kinase [Burkholderiales bacterium]
MKLQHIIEQHWYNKANPFLTLLLFPFSIIYAIIVRIRKCLFIFKLKTQTKIAIPVVVIGNISVGGAGKTPLTKALAAELIARGIKVGIILRGYKGNADKELIVKTSDSSAVVGDEAMIYAQAGFRVAIARKRVAAAQLLLREYPDTQLILADDGMQHYYLDRDMEICVVESSRMFGNQHVLPLGPLREGMNRLNSVDAIVVNGYENHDRLANILAKYKVPVYYQVPEFVHFYNPQTQHIATVQEMKDKQLMAIAAIGNPTRFFSYLENLGVKLIKQQAFPDHYHYLKSDINSQYAIITTEKDYTKLAQFAASNIWVAVVNARLDNNQLIEQMVHLTQKEYKTNGS